MVTAQYLAQSARNALRRFDEARGRGRLEIALVWLRAAKASARQLRKHLDTIKRGTASPTYLYMQGTGKWAPVLSGAGVLQFVGEARYSHRQSAARAAARELAKRMRQ